jgi:4'-phosphopantetheinyl transferase
METKPEGPSLGHWKTARGVPPLAPGELHLWRVDPPLPGTAPDLAILCPAERRRAASIHNCALRDQFLHTHAAKRRILGGYLGVTPERVRFRHGPRGKPFLDWPGPAPWLNLTHSGQLCLLAVSPDLELGLDLEQVRPRRCLSEIARRMFPTTVATHLESLPEAQRLREFHVYWTRLEAGVKALGGGLLDPGSRDQAGLHFLDFMPAPGFQACLAGRGTLPPMARWRLLSYRSLGEDRP